MIFWLKQQAEKQPNKRALIVSDPGAAGHALTYGELFAEVEAMVGRWLAAGIQPREHVGLLAQSSLLTVVHIYAAQWLECVLVPLNTRLTVPEMDFQLRQAEVASLLPVGDAATLSALQTLGHRVADINGVTPVETLPPLPTAKIKPPQNASVVSPLDTNDHRPLAIIHTSGTSGKPKGAVLTWGNFMLSALASAQRLGRRDDDRWLGVLPLYHVGGLNVLFRSALAGTTVDLVTRFDPADINHRLTHTTVTLVSLVPTMLHRLLETRQQPWNPSLRAVLLGGAAASAALLTRSREEGIPVATTYGLTEACSQVATATPEEVLARPGTVGRPLDFVEVVIRQMSAETAPYPVEAGEIGEISVRGLTVMREYYNNPAATQRAFLTHDWLMTGDIGFMDAQGYLYIIQRRSDLIISGGENVYPAEVEAVIEQHPAVRAVAVVGLPHPEWGQQVAAAVVLQPDMSLTEAELNTFCRDYLAGYKLPRRVIFVSELPLTASGKVARTNVPDLFA